MAIVAVKTLDIQSFNIVFFWNYLHWNFILSVTSTYEAKKFEKPVENGINWVVNKFEEGAPNIGLNWAFLTFWQISKFRAVREVRLQHR